MVRKAASYVGLKPASKGASAAAQGSSKKKDTKPELTLRRALWKAGFRYRKHAQNLPGKPDIIFPGARVAVFCDGDFWHGRDWDNRRSKLATGSNPEYWIAKIEGNIARDRTNDRLLAAQGWRVVRVWESEVLNQPGKTVQRIRRALNRERRA